MVLVIMAVNISGRLARIVSGIVPTQWEVMPVITADIMSGMIPVIVAMAHPKDRAYDRGAKIARITKTVQAWDEVPERRALKVPTPRPVRSKHCTDRASGRPRS
jgi:hypothetical protein